MTEKSLPEIYREAADLVLKAGKVEGSMKVATDGRCYGFCTMGAVFEAAGLMKDDGDMKDDGFVSTPEFLRLASPVADQIEKSGRRERWNFRRENDRAFWTIADWNDEMNAEGKTPTAEDVAALLRETADAVESDSKEVSA